MYRKILKEFIYEIDNQAPNTIKSFEKNIFADENFLKNFFKKIYEKTICFIKEDSNLYQTSPIFLQLEFEKENIDKIKWYQIDNRVSAYMIVLSTINLKCILYINDALYDNENVELLFTWAIGLLMKTYELHNTKEIIKKNEDEIIEKFGHYLLTYKEFLKQIFKFNEINRELNKVLKEPFDKIKMVPYIITALAFITKAVNSKISIVDPSTKAEKKEKLYILLINELIKSDKAKENKLLESIFYNMADFFKTLSKYEKIKHEELKHEKFISSSYFYNKLSEQKYINNHKLGKETIKKIFYIASNHFKRNNDDYGNIIKDIINERIKSKEEFINFLETKDYKDKVDQCVDISSMKKRFNRIIHDKYFICIEELMALCFVNTLLSDIKFNNQDEFDKYRVSVHKQYKPVYEIAAYIHNSSKEMQKKNHNSETNENEYVEISSRKMQKKNIIEYLIKCISIFNEIQEIDMNQPEKHKKDIEM